MGLLSAIYNSALICRGFIYSHFKKPGKLPAKVISVGNITLGGTGKSPAVIAIAEEAGRRGYQPCILTRGYKGKAKGPCFIGEKQGSGFRVQGPAADMGLCNTAPCYVPADPLVCGDEPALMAQRLKDVPIVKCADRYKGGLFALNSIILTPKSVFIIDDGFQHWGLHRDIDIVLIDATNPFGNEKLFPEGRLREPLSSLKRAGIIVLAKVDAVSKNAIRALIQKIKKYNAEAPVFTASHKPSSLVKASGEVIGLDTLKNKKIYVFSGIANPEYFKDILIANGADIAGYRAFRDHHIYKQRDMDRIRTEASGLDILTTEKDLVKLNNLQLSDNMLALKIEFTVEDAFYDVLFKKI